MNRALLAVALLGSLGCTVDRRIPDARLTCRDDQGCPAGHRCLPYRGRMVCCREGTCASDGGEAAPPQDDGAVTVSVDGSLATDDAATPSSAPDAGSPSAEGGSMPADAAARDAAVDQAPPKIACAAGACSGQANCVGGFCEPAPATCAALKQAGPSLGDGVYWIQLAGRPRRAYCDMMTGEILCAERAARNGTIREGSGFKFSLQSELQAGEV